MKYRRESDRHSAVIWSIGKNKLDVAGDVEWKENDPTTDSGFVIRNFEGREGGE